MIIFYLFYSSPERNGRSYYCLGLFCAVFTEPATQSFSKVCSYYWKFPNIDYELLHRYIQNADVQGVLSTISWYLDSLDDLWERHNVMDLDGELREDIDNHYNAVRFMILTLLRRSKNYKMEYIRHLYRRGSYATLRSMIKTIDASTLQEV